MNKLPSQWTQFHKIYLDTMHMLFSVVVYVWFGFGWKIGLFDELYCIVPLQVKLLFTYYSVSIWHFSSVDIGYAVVLLLAYLLPMFQFTHTSVVLFVPYTLWSMLAALGIHPIGNCRRSRKFGMKSGNFLQVPVSCALGLSCILHFRLFMCCSIILFLRLYTVTCVFDCDVW